MKKTEKEIIPLRLGGGKILEIPVYRRKNAKSLFLCLKANGKIRLSSPYGISLRKLSDFAHSKRAELEDGLAKISQQKIPLPQSIYWPPETQAYEVEWTWDNFLQDASLTLDNHRIAVTANPQNQIAAIVVLQNVFRQKAKEYLPRFIADLAPALAFKTRIGNQERSMGSCSRRLPAQKAAKSLPMICLNWRASFLELEQLRHVCWHELAHISHMNHSEDFYRQLEAYSPGCKNREKELSAAWLALPAWVRYHA